MRARPLTALAVWMAFGVPAGLLDGCSKAAPPGEDVGSSTGPPITICYLPDGALCPLDAGDDAAQTGDDDAASDGDSARDALSPG